MQAVSPICRRFFLTDLSFSSATGGGAHPDLASGGHRTGARGRHGESSVAGATAVQGLVPNADSGTRRQCGGSHAIVPQISRL
jgi:hypothetical protein